MLFVFFIRFRLTIYEKKQIDIKKEEKLAHEKEMKIHEDKMHKLNIQVKEFEVSYIDQVKNNNIIFAYYFRILIKNVVL
jgi:hypothetical protein